jgi:hypothetical protein
MSQMKPAKIAFAGPTGTLLNYCSDIRNIQITHTSAGHYTVQFLTSCSLDESKVIYPFINVTCQSPTGSATLVNVLNPTATYQSQNSDGYLYQISFQIETQNVVIQLPSLLTPLSGSTLVSFVDAPVVMIDCEMTEVRSGLGDEDALASARKVERAGDQLLEFVEQIYHEFAEYERKRSLAQTASAKRSSDTLNRGKEVADKLAGGKVIKRSKGKEGADKLAGGKVKRSKGKEGADKLVKGKGGADELAGGKVIKHSKGKEGADKLVKGKGGADKLAGGKEKGPWKYDYDDKGF